jgi:hypothetical protein
MDNFINFFPHKLSKDIINVIYKYNDISTKNLVRLISPIRKLGRFTIKPGLTIMDIIIRALINGYEGFLIYNYKVNIELISYIKNNINDKRIKYILQDETYMFYFDNTMDLECIDIDSLDCLVYYQRIN